MGGAAVGSGTHTFANVGRLAVAVGRDGLLLALPLEQGLLLRHLPRLRSHAPACVGSAAGDPAGTYDSRLNTSLLRSLCCCCCAAAAAVGEYTSAAAMASGDELSRHVGADGR